ncbi:MAG: acyl-CoA dehydrogenase family protein [Chloroflexi bacterium]|nr:acyl-CoA dehydrogenase family protein [Chloroflexota bacterium]
MEITLPEDMKQLQMLVRKFIQKELLPIEKQVEELGEFPEELRRPLKKKAIDLGLWNVAMPREYGGGGVGYLGWVLINEELGHVSTALGARGGIIGGPRTGSGHGSEFRFATQEQIDKYFLPMLRGDREMFVALTEANAGSDLGNIETRAIRNGDSYVLNGTKLYVTAIDVSDFGLVLAVTDWEKRRKGGFTCFIVEKNTPGLILSRQLPMMGRRGLHSYEVSLENCVVPAANILGQLGQGLEVVGAEVNGLRLAGAAASLGTAERAVEMAKSHAKERITFGQPLAQRQIVQQMIARAEVDIYASRLMLYDAAMDADQGKDVTLKTMMVKTFVTEMAIRHVDRAMQIHGGLGYSKEYPLEMMYRDTRLRTLTEGATEILEWTIARNLLRS